MDFFDEPATGSPQGQATEEEVDFNMDGDQEAEQSSPAEPAQALDDFGFDAPAAPAAASPEPEAEAQAEPEPEAEAQAEREPEPVEEAAPAPAAPAMDDFGFDTPTPAPAAAAEPEPAAAAPAEELAATPAASGLNAVDAWKVQMAEDMAKRDAAAAAKLKEMREAAQAALKEFKDSRDALIASNKQANEQEEAEACKQRDALFAHGERWERVASQVELKGNDKKHAKMARMRGMLISLKNE